MSDVCRMVLSILCKDTLRTDRSTGALKKSEGFQSVVMDEDIEYAMQLRERALSESVKRRNCHVAFCMTILFVPTCLVLVGVSLWSQWLFVFVTSACCLLVVLYLFALHVIPHIRRVKVAGTLTNVPRLPQIN